MLLWEKILLTLSTTNFITMCILLIVYAFDDDDNESLKTIKAKVAFIFLSIFLVEFILFMAYLVIFKLILGAIWGIHIQLFSFM